MRRRAVAAAPRHVRELLASQFPAAEDAPELVGQYRDVWGNDET